MTREPADDPTDRSENQSAAERTARDDTTGGSPAPAAGADVETATVPTGEIAVSTSGSEPHVLKVETEAPHDRADEPGRTARIERTYDVSPRRVRWVVQSFLLERPERRLASGVHRLSAEGDDGSVVLQYDVARREGQTQLRVTLVGTGSRPSGDAAALSDHLARQLPEPVDHTEA